MIASCCLIAKHQTFSQACLAVNPIRYCPLSLLLRQYGGFDVIEVIYLPEQPAGSAK